MAIELTCPAGVLPSEEAYRDDIGSCGMQADVDGEHYRDFPGRQTVNRDAKGSRVDQDRQRAHRSGAETLSALWTQHVIHSRCGELSPGPGFSAALHRKEDIDSRSWSSNTRALDASARL
ncbi:MAG: hypothetical protein E5V36_17410 [Mesorhizobium sp.]|nr:MAG: hypothetical protein E5V36_17410 [Mesorhizobium sp.]